MGDVFVSGLHALDNSMLRLILSTLGRGIAYTILGILGIVTLASVIAVPAVLFSLYVTSYPAYVVAFLGLWVALLLGLTLATVENFGNDR